MKDYKYFLIFSFLLFIIGFGALSFDSYLKSQEKQKQLDIEKLKLELKLKEKR